MEKREKLIDGRTYALLLPPVRPAMQLCTKVSVLVGPVLGGLGTDINNAGWEKFGAALSGVDPLKVDELVMEAVRISKLCCDNQPVCDDITFGKHFDAHRADVYPVSLWCLWECVKDFFPQLGTFTQKAQEMMNKTVKVSRSLQDGK